MRLVSVVLGVFVVVAIFLIPSRGTDVVAPAQPAGVYGSVTEADLVSPPVESESVPYYPDPEFDSDLQARAEVLLARAEAAEQKVIAYETTFNHLEAMRFQVRQLECKAALEPDGQIGLWAATVDVVPDEATLLRMAQLLHDYPVELQPEDGLWLVDRIRLDDWYTFAPTVDEAIAAYFGDRIKLP
jgi:hypothetical protein